MIINIHKKYLLKKFLKKIFLSSVIFLILILIINLIEEANFLIKQIKDLKKLSESTSGCKSARHRRTCMARKKVRYQADIKPIEGKLAKLGWVKVGERHVKAGTVLG